MKDLATFPGNDNEFWGLLAELVPENTVAWIGARKTRYIESKRKNVFEWVSGSRPRKIDLDRFRPDAAMDGIPKDQGRDWELALFVSKLGDSAEDLKWAIARTIEKDPKKNRKMNFVCGSYFDAP